MKTNFIQMLTLSFTLLSCQLQSQNMQTIEVKVFESFLEKEMHPQLIDVRTPKEYADGKIKNAVNIDWNGSDFISRTKNLDKTKPVFVYCLSGGRSKAAAAKLAENGFVKVYDLKGGIMKWNASHQSKADEVVSEKIIGVCPQEYTEMLKKSTKTIVNIYAEWCAPCKKMAPYLKKMQAELKGKINLVRYDADENKTILKTLKIDVLPVILIYEGEKLIWQHAGYLSENDLKKQIQ